MALEGLELEPAALYVVTMAPRPSLDVRGLRRMPLEAARSVAELAARAGMVPRVLLVPVDAPAVPYTRAGAPVLGVPLEVGA